MKKHKQWVAKFILVIMCITNILPIIGYASIDITSDNIGDVSTSSNIFRGTGVDTNKESNNANRDVATGSNMKVKPLSADSITYKVKFYNLEMSNEPIEIVYILEGEKLNEIEHPSIPTKYKRFEGWFEDESDEAFDFEGFEADRDINLYAKFTNYCTIYLYDENILIKSITIDHGEILNKPDLISVLIEPKDNLVYTGNWFIRDTLDYYSFGEVVTEDTNLTMERVSKYVVTFDTKTNREELTQYIKHKDTVNKPKNPERDGYSFLYWASGDVEFDFNTVVSENIHLVAVYSSKQVNYRVVYLLEKNGLPLDFNTSLGVDDVNNYMEVYSELRTAYAGTDTSRIDTTDLRWKSSYNTEDNEANFTLNNHAEYYKTVWNTDKVEILGNSQVYVYYTRSVFNIRFETTRGSNSNYLLKGKFLLKDGDVALDGLASYNLDRRVKMGMDTSGMFPKIVTEDGDYAISTYNVNNPKLIKVLYGWGNARGILNSVDSITSSILSNTYYDYKWTASNGVKWYRYNSQLTSTYKQRHNIYYVESLDQNSHATKLTPEISFVSEDRIAFDKFYVNSSKLYPVRGGEYVCFDKVSDNKTVLPNDWYTTEQSRVGFTGLKVLKYEFVLFSRGTMYTNDIGFVAGYKTISGESKVLYHMYLRNKYKLNFEGTYRPVESVSVRYEDTISQFIPDTAETPQMYAFDGWYLDGEFKVKYNKDSKLTMPAGDMTLYAKYVRNSFIVKYAIENNGVVIVSETVSMGNTPNTNIIPQSYYDEGSLVGFYYIDENTKQLVRWTFKERIYRDYTVFGVWDKNVYSLKYSSGISNKKSPVDSNVYIAGVNAKVKNGNDLSDNKNVFIGWLNKETNMLYRAGHFIKITGNTELIAQYALRKQTVKLTFTEDDGTLLGDNYYIIHDTVVLPLASELGVNKSGYTFLGWKSGTNIGDMYDYNKKYVINKDEVLIAIWEEGEELNIDDLEISEDSETLENLEIPEIPEKVEKVDETRELEKADVIEKPVLDSVTVEAVTEKQTVETGKKDEDSKSKKTVVKELETVIKVVVNKSEVKEKAKEQLDYEYTPDKVKDRIREVVSKDDITDEEYYELMETIKEYEISSNERLTTGSLPKTGDVNCRLQYYCIFAIICASLLHIYIYRIKKKIED